MGKGKERRLCVYACSKQHNILIQAGKGPPVPPAENKGAPGPHEKQLVLVLPQGILFMPETPSPETSWMHPDAQTSASTGSSTWSSSPTLNVSGKSELLILFLRMSPATFQRKLSSLCLWSPSLNHYTHLITTSEEKNTNWPINFPLPQQTSHSMHLTTDSAEICPSCFLFTCESVHWSSLLFVKDRTNLYVQ